MDSVNSAGDTPLTKAASGIEMLYFETYFIKCLRLFEMCLFVLICLIAYSLSYELQGLLSYSVDPFNYGLELL